jgi:hypothetical protein
MRLAFPVRSNGFAAVHRCIGASVAFASAPSGFTACHPHPVSPPTVCRLADGNCGTV